MYITTTAPCNFRAHHHTRYSVHLRRENLAFEKRDRFVDALRAAAGSPSAPGPSADGSSEAAEAPAFRLRRLPLLEDRLRFAARAAVARRFFASFASFAARRLV